MTLFAELLHRSADAREVLRTCTGSSWQVEGRERAGCLPWCFSSLQPLPGATERCLPCPALVNTSCPPALPALPPLLPPSYHSAFPPPPLLRLSLPIFFLLSLLPFVVSPVPFRHPALFSYRPVALSSGLSSFPLISRGGGCHLAFFFFPFVSCSLFLLSCILFFPFLSSLSAPNFL